MAASVVTVRGFLSLMILSLHVRQPADTYSWMDAAQNTDNVFANMAAAALGMEMALAAASVFNLCLRIRKRYSLCALVVQPQTQDTRLHPHTAKSRSLAVSTQSEVQLMPPLKSMAMRQ